MQVSGSVVYVGGDALDDGPRGRSILTAADYVMCGNSSGTVQFLVVTKMTSVKVGWHSMH